MKISTKSRYGLRAMVGIAKRGDGFVKSEVLSKEENISKKYLDSILGELRKRGFLSTMRGGTGGYRMRKNAKNVTVADIVEALDGKIAFVSCLEDCSPCEREKGCSTQRVWEEASVALRKTLAKINLADLAEGKA